MDVVSWIGMIKDGHCINIRDIMFVMGSPAGQDLIAEWYDQ